MKSTTRFIPVISPGRSGSSCVAGLLHNAGIPMGIDSHLIPRGEYNKKGHYEDKCFHDVTGGMIGTVANISITETNTWFGIYADLVKSHRQYPIWGLKDPAFCVIWPRVEKLFGDDIRVVVVHRRFDGVVNSRINSQGMLRKYAEQFHTYTLAHMYSTLHKIDYPMFHVQYEELVEDTKQIVTKLLSFCSSGINITLDYQSAIDFVSPELRNY